jgi:hypothetical protein
MTISPIKNGPKALAIQIMDGPLVTKSGMNRIKTIMGSSSIGIQTRRGFQADAAVLTSISALATSALWWL